MNLSKVSVYPAECPEVKREVFLRSHDRLGTSRSFGFSTARSRLRKWLTFGLCRVFRLTICAAVKWYVALRSHTLSKSNFESVTGDLRQRYQSWVIQIMSHGIFTGHQLKEVPHIEIVESARPTHPKVQPYLCVCLRGVSTSYGGGKEGLTNKLGEVLP